MNINLKDIDPKSAAIGAGVIVAASALVKATTWAWKKLRKPTEAAPAVKAPAAPAEAAPASAGA